MRFSRVFYGLVALCLVGVLAGHASALTIQDGYLAGTEDGGTLRFKNLKVGGSFPNTDIYLFGTNVGDRTNAEYNYPSITYFDFSYNVNTGLIWAGYGNSANPQDMTWMSYDIIDRDDYNYMQFSMRAYDVGTSVALNGLVLNGQSLGDIGVTYGDGWVDWFLQGVNLSAGFSMQGMLSIAGDFVRGDEYSKAQISFGHNPSATPIPGAVWLLGSGLAGLIGFRRKMKQ